jgi:hypothetical protein
MATDQPPRAPSPERERTLFFLHIAGTGASALRPLLMRAYEDAEVAFVYEQSDLPDVRTADEYRHSPVRERGRLRLVMGGFPFGIHKGVPAPFAYTTLLRDPLERVVSLYDRFRDRVPAGREVMSMEEFVFGQQRLSVDNGMVRAIAGRHMVRWGQCPDDLLDEAVAHIEEHFAALLAADDPPASLATLGRITGRDLVASGESVDIPRPDVSGVDPRSADRIRELNVLDGRLLAWARDRTRSAG